MILGFICSVRTDETHTFLDFLLFSGDFTRHHQNEMPSPWKNVTNVVKKVTEIMGKAFPDLLAAGRFSLGTQGNDDAPGRFLCSLPPCFISSRF